MVIVLGKDKMKHPNKKIEAIRKEYAWALMSRKRMAVKSCFYYWLDENANIEQIPMTEDELLNAVANIRRGGKTVRIGINDL